MTSTVTASGSQTSSTTMRRREPTWDGRVLRRADVDEALRLLGYSSTPLSRAWISALAWMIWHRLSKWGLWAIVHGFFDANVEPDMDLLDPAKVPGYGPLERELQRWQLVDRGGRLTPFGRLVQQRAKWVAR